MYQSDTPKVFRDYLPEGQLTTLPMEHTDSSNWPKLHEDYTKLENRMMRGVKDMEEKYLLDPHGQVRRERVVVVVSHAGCVDAVARYKGVQTQRMIGYCGILSWKYNTSITD